MTRLLALAILIGFGTVIVGAVVVGLSLLAWQAIRGHPGAGFFLAAFVLIGVAFAVSWAVGVLYDDSMRGAKGR